MARSLMRGSEAIGLAALMSGVEAYFGYPITPSSEIMEYMSRMVGDPQFPWYRTFIQASSELEAVNMMMGAGAAGHMAMTATSGPGLSLMAEGISYAAASEIPFLIVDVNRGGPGLGNVAPEQSDYRFVTKGLGHGGSRAIVMAPASISEAMSTVRAGLEAAFRYRSPAVVLVDAIVVHMREDVEVPAIGGLMPSAGWAARGKGEGPRHGITSFYLEPEELAAHKAHLEDKWHRMEEELELFECYLCEDAELGMISYGISARIARAAVKGLRGMGIRAGLFRPISLCPFPAEALRESLGRASRFVVVEMSEGQLLEDVRSALGPGANVEGRLYLGGITPSEGEITA